MTNNLSLIFKKYSVPVLFLIMGGLVLYIGLTSEQSTLFLLSSVMMFLAGGLSIAFSSGKLKRGVLLVFGVLAGITSLLVLYIAGKSVSDTQKHQKAYDFMVVKAQQNLSDIRYIQKTYFEKEGKYLQTWEELTDFVNNGTVDKVIAEGTVPNVRLIREEEKFLYNDNRPLDNNMTEVEAFRLSKWKEGPRYNEFFKGFRRDTVKEPILDYKFKTQSYLESREKLGLEAFEAENLAFIPDTENKEKWDLITKDDVVIGNDTVSVVRVEGTLPYTRIEGEPASKREKVYFGSLINNNLGGSWEE